MKKVLVTGINGTIGSVLTQAIGEKYKVVGLDLPEGDIRNYNTLLEKMKGVDVVIHVAHSANEEMRENWRSGRIDPANVLMEMNVFRAVIEAGVKRLIMASSVHADNFNAYEGTDILTVPGSYEPTSPYGAHKLIVEEMGRFYANLKEFEFIGVRFGGVTPDNSVRTHLKETRVWLSHDDLIASINACISADVVPNGFSVFYAISDNDGRMHSFENPFGWVPKDNSKDYL